MSNLTIPGHLYTPVMQLVNDHGYSVEDAIAKAAADAARTRQDRPHAPEGAKADHDTGAGDTAPQKRHKYGAKKITIDGHTFPSLAEGRRYEELKLMQQQGHIKHLTLQPRYQIRIDGVLVTTYVADFRYQDVETGETVVEDVKGFKTPVYKLKRKLMQVVNGIEIQEIQA